MDFFSRLGESLSATGRDVSNKAREITEVTRLTFEIRNKEDYLRRQFEEVGRKYFNLHKDEELYDMDFQEIKETLYEINNIKMEIAQWKGLKQCMECGEVMKLNALYCEKCGKKWEQIYVEE